MPLSKDDVQYIRHVAVQSYQAGVQRGQALSVPLEERLDGAVGFSVAHVDKYSPDQTAWARKRFEQEQSWRRGYRLDAQNMIRRMRYGTPRLSACDFERYFPAGPEEGQATRAGNIFVAQGLTNLISLWLGLTGTAVHVLAAAAGGSGLCGVGTGTSAAATSDTKLISDNGSAWYQAFDQAPATTTTNGQVVGTTTYGSANANFAWNEWCWATGSGAVTAGSVLGTSAAAPYGVGNTGAMVNHKTNVNLGSKASGSSWVFSTTFTIS